MNAYDILSLKPGIDRISGEQEKLKRMNAYDTGKDQRGE